MARIDAPAPQNVPEAARESGFFRTVSHAPAITETAIAHSEAVMGEGRVPQQLKELMAILISALNQCEYCLNARKAEAERLGVEPQVLQDLHDYARSDKYTAGEKAALSAAIALTREPRALPDTIWNELRAHFDDAQIVELLAVIGLFNYFNRLNNALQITG
jgi:uncharacterized peroxidase-related enzyme